MYYRANHQNSVVYNQNTCTLLQDIVDTAEGRRPAPLRSKTGPKVPPFPQRGEVDIIFGGKQFIFDAKIRTNVGLGYRAALPEFLPDQP